MTTLSTTQLIEAMRTVAIAADTEQGREKLNAIANRMEMLVAANAGMDLQLNSIRAALNIPVNTSVQAGVFAETSRLNDEVLSLRSELSESVALANKLRRTAKEHQEENQQLRTKLEIYDRAAREPAEYKVVDPFGEITLRREKCEAEMYRELKGWNVTDLYTVPPLAVVPDEVTEFTKPNSSYEWRKGYNACIAAMLQHGNPVWSGIDWAKGCGPAPVIPEDWALVPVTADSEMMAAAIACGVTRGMDGALYVKYDDIYTAMVAAAPKFDRKDGDA
ncbi:hypothetical protein F6Q06_08475 [Pectobacterium parmentieri]|uniref:Phage protein n=1 Tax=Pectobacterium parmentieri TaxID=1905730 RepID=A0ABS0RY22_PECPM|nr:hypothetical protein [Pectobacterium parmentieri]MBI0554524.1 hypothetical protein [Pectobacterium parmentieri]